MKKILYISLITLLFSQCTQAENNKSANKSEQKTNTTYIQHINRAQFLTQVFNIEKDKKEVKYLGNKPCIVDFYADWCGPCRKLSPILEELANEYKGKIIVYKVDTEKEKQIASELGIQALPTLVFFPLKGQPILTQGLLPKEELKKIIDKELLKTTR